jgi:cation transport ATPase
MHDVHRDSMLYQGKSKNTKKSAHKNDYEKTRSSDAHEHEHEVNHEHHDHDNEIPHGHQHEHDDSEYTEHEEDDHVHSHDHGTTEDRAFTHVHDHGHNFFHGHFHSHHPKHTTAMHKIFGNPLRDWFAAGLMGVLIIIGYFQLLPGHLSDGMLVCAAVIGIFPVMKNAIFECLAQRRFDADILVGALLLTGLLLGRFIEVATCALLLLIGSFLRLNFSWRND